jgi:hypothetical protein
LGASRRAVTRLRRVFLFVPALRVTLHDPEGGIASGASTARREEPPRTSMTNADLKKRSSAKMPEERFCDERNISLLSNYLGP